MVKLQQGDVVRVSRDIYGKRVDVEAVITATTSQYYVLELSDGQSFHCYKADAELVRSAEQDKRTIR